MLIPYNHKHYVRAHTQALPHFDNMRHKLVMLLEYTYLFNHVHRVCFNCCSQGRIYKPVENHLHTVKVEGAWNLTPRKRGDRHEELPTVLIRQGAHSISQRTPHTSALERLEGSAPSYKT